MNDSQRFRVLFVCIGNSCRSPMAEAIANAEHGDVFEASSAGLTPASIVQPQTYQTLAEIGVELAADKKPIALKKADWQAADLLVNMSGMGVLSVIPKFQGMNLIWEVPDPMGRPLEVYRSSRDLIRSLIERLADKLRANRR